MRSAKREAYVTTHELVPNHAPPGFLFFLEATNRFAAGMWGGLGDIPFRVSLKTITAEISKPKSATHSSIWPIRNARESEALFRMLTTGRLVVRETDFLAWYEAEHARGQWESQRSRKKILGGRPSKQTKSLENTILGLV